MKKGDVVADDEDDDSVRTIVSQGRVTATLCTVYDTVIAHWYSVYVYSSPHKGWYS